MNSDILLFSSAYWDDPFITPQQIAIQLARSRRVLFVEPSPSYIHLRDVSRNRRWLKIGRGVRRVDGGVYVYSPPPMLPLKTRSPLLNAASQWWVRPFIHRAIASVGLKDLALLTFIPHVYRTVGRFGERLVCYYCIDDMGALSKVIDPKVVAGYERELLSRADLVLTTSRTQRKRFEEQRHSAHLIPNGCDPNLYSRALMPETALPPFMADLPHPILGFSGSIDFRLDQVLIAEAARRRPEWSFVFVGPVRTSVAALDRLPNVRFVPSQPVSELPAYFKGFDVALIPYVLGPMVASVYPAKLNEYLAAGLPVITSVLPELADCPDDIASQVPDVDAFIDAVERLWQTRWNVERIATRAEFANRNSWENRASQVAELIDERLEQVQSAATAGARCHIDAAPKRSGDPG